MNKDQSREQIGLIADEVAKVDNRLVTYDSNGDIHGFNYEQYTAWITKAVQELNTKVDTMKGAVRSVEENWQDLFIGLLILGMIYQQFQIRKIKK